MEPAAWAATFAGVSALGTVGAVAIAAYSLLGARRDSRDRTRPVVIAQLRRGPRFGKTTYLTVQNVGATPARNLRVTFDPALPSAKSDAQGDRT